MPWPPPMHWVASANFLPSRFSKAAALPVMRAPVAPSGWPSAMAPPSRLTFVDVDLEVADAGHGLRGEGLVELR